MLKLTFSKCLLAVLLSMFSMLSAAQANLEQISDDMAHHLMPQASIALMAGDTPFTLAYHDANTPITRGVAVLISETGDAPISDLSLGPIARQLNDLGWVTLAMPVGNFGLPTPVAAPVNDNNASENPTDTPAMPMLAPQEQLMQMQLQATLQKTRDYPGFTLFISEGTSAAWIAKLLADKSLTNPDALVVLNPYWPRREDNAKIAGYLAATQVPVLDLRTENENLWAKESASQRKIAAQKALKLHYRQRLLPMPRQHEAYRGVPLSKEIYGWITNMGW